MNPKNHRPLLLACCLALATCVILPATACRELFPDKGYIARVWIRVPMSRPDTVFRVPDAEPPFTTARDEVIAMFHSDSVLESALVLPGISDLGCLEGVADKTGWLRERLETKFVGGSEILEVTITGKDPEDLKKLVMAVCQAFIEEKRLQDDPGELALEEGSYEMGKEKLAEKRLQYQALVEETGMQNSEEAKELNKGMIERIEKLRDQVQLILVEKVGLERKIELLEERLKNTPEEMPMPERSPYSLFSFEIAEDILQKDAVYSQLLQEIAEQRAGLKALEQDVENPDENPDVIALREQLEQTWKKMTARAEELVTPLVKEADDYARQAEKYAQTAAGRLREELETTKINKGVEQAKLDFTMNDFQQNVDRAEKRRENGLALDALLAEIDKLEKMLRGIKDHEYEVILKAATDSRMQMIGEPTVQKL